MIHKMAPVSLKEFVLAPQLCKKQPNNLIAIIWKKVLSPVWEN